MFSTVVDTLTFMIAGFTVIFGFILVYIVSLLVRFRRTKEKISTYQTLLEE